MTAVTTERIGNVRRAELVIRAAHGTERHYPREPDDARLGEMLASVRQLAETLTNDRARWAAQ